jgi:uncharacterized membrane protein
MEEPLISPISTDKNLPVKDLLEKDSEKPVNMVEKTKKKKSFFYFVSIGVVMIILVIFGLLFGFYTRSQQSDPSPTTVEPTPTVVEEAEEATPASTLEVIINKMDTLEDKLDSDSFLESELLPPAMDFDLEERLKGIR